MQATKADPLASKPPNFDQFDPPAYVANYTTALLLLGLAVALSPGRAHWVDEREMITGREIRDARLLVRWNLQQLAQAARLPINSVMLAELLDRASVGTVVHAIAIRESGRPYNLQSGAADQCRVSA